MDDPLTAFLCAWIEDLARRQTSSSPPTTEAKDLHAMRWSLGLEDPTQRVFGPDDEPRKYLLPDGTRTNSCDAARRAWMEHANPADP